MNRQSPAKSHSLLVYAHRGASGTFPENTILAFQKAVELGAKAIEFDLILTTDGHYVIHHDFKIRNADQQSFDLRKMSRPAIEKQINGRLSAESRLAFLEQLLEVMPADIILNAELKTAYPHPYRKNVRRLCAILEKASKPERIIVSSFHLDAIYFLQKISKLSTAYLFMAHQWGQFLSYRALHRRRLPDAVHLELGHPHLAQWVKRSPVSVFTINDIKTAEELAKQGVSGIFSDFPDYFK